MLKDVYIIGEKEEIICTMASSAAEKLIRPQLIWSLPERNLSLKHSINVSLLEEGRYNWICKATNVNLKELAVVFFVISKNATVQLGDENRWVYLISDTLPVCSWSSPFMNKHDTFKIFTTDRTIGETANVFKIQRTCLHNNYNIKVNFTKYMYIIDPKDFEIKSVPPLNIFSTNTKSIPKVSCNLSSFFEPDAQYHTQWITIVKSRIFNPEGTFLVHNTSATFNKDEKEEMRSDIFGSYICISYFGNKTLTYIYTVMMYEPIISGNVAPRSREIMNSEKVTCISFGAKYVEAYSLLSIMNIKTGEFINFPTMGLIQINVDRPVKSLISCKIHQIYFYIVLSSETIDTIMVLTPMNYTELKSGVNLRCVTTGARDLDFTLSAQLLKAPDYMTMHTTARFTTGEYLIGCILTEKDGPLWIDEYELSQRGEPQRVFLSAYTVKHEVQFRCNSDGFPLQSVVSKIRIWNQTVFLNLTKNSGEASFTVLTDYGIYSIGCVVKGVYLGKTFSLSGNLSIYLTGPLYELKSMFVAKKQESIIILFLLQFVIFFIIVGMFMLWFHSAWLKYQNNHNLGEDTMDDNYFKANSSFMANEYYGINADEMQPADLIKVMGLITLYDSCYDYYKMTSGGEDQSRKFKRKRMERMSAVFMKSAANCFGRGGVPKIEE